LAELAIKENDRRFDEEREQAWIKPAASYDFSDRESNCAAIIYNKIPRA